MLERLKKRALSHSQLSSFEYDPEQWYQSYILGERQPPTAEMLAGSRIGDAIGTDDTPIPELQPPGVKEYELHGEWDGIPLIGYADHYCPDTKVLHENKTSPNKRRWTQSKVDKHDQLTMYAMLLQLKDGVEPEEITMYLNFIPVCLTGVTLNVCGGYRQFETRRTKEDVTRYQAYIMDTLERMDEYVRVRSTQPEKPAAPMYNG